MIPYKLEKRTKSQLIDTVNNHSRRIAELEDKIGEWQKALGFFFVAEGEDVSSNTPEDLVEYIRKSDEEVRDLQSENDLLEDYSERGAKRIAELEAQLKPSDGGEFDRAVEGSLEYSARMLPDDHDYILGIMKRLTKAHTADRAADRERIAELEQELSDQKEVYGCTVGELKEEVERLKSDFNKLLAGYRDKLRDETFPIQDRVADVIASITVILIG